MPERPGGPAVPATPVASPCVRNCCLDDQDICLGCFRTLQEICAWSACSDSEKHRILARADRRKDQRTRISPENLQP